MLLRCTIADIDQLLTDLKDLPRQIEDKGRESWELKQQIASLQSEIDERRYQLEYEIRTDKETYKNEASREAAIRTAMNADDGVRRRMKDIADYENMKQMCDRSTWKLKDEFTVLKYQLRASCGVLEGLCDPIVREVLHGKREIGAGAGQF